MGEPEFNITSALMTQKKYKIHAIGNPFSHGALRSFWAQVSTKWGNSVKNDQEWNLQYKSLESGCLLDQSHKADYLSVVNRQQWEPTSSPVIVVLLESMPPVSTEKGTCKHEDWLVWAESQSASLILPSLQLGTLEAADSWRHLVVRRSWDLKGSHPKSGTGRHLKRRVGFGGVVREGALVWMPKV